MKQIIHDLYSGDEVDTLDFQWDANWRPVAGTNPFKTLSDFALSKKNGNWDELCNALAEVLTVNGEKISGAAISTRLNGEWIYMGQIVEGVIANAMRQLQGRIKPPKA